MISYRTFTLLSSIYVIILTFFISLFISGVSDKLGKGEDPLNSHCKILILIFSIIIYFSSYYHDKFKRIFEKEEIKRDPSYLVKKQYGSMSTFFMFITIINIIILLYCSDITTIINIILSLVIGIMINYFYKFKSKSVINIINVILCIYAVLNIYNFIINNTINLILKESRTIAALFGLCSIVSVIHSIRTFIFINKK